MLIRDTIDAISGIFRLMYCLKNLFMSINTHESVTCLTASVGIVWQNKIMNEKQLIELINILNYDDLVVAEATDDDNRVLVLASDGDELEKALAQFADAKTLRADRGDIASDFFGLIKDDRVRKISDLNVFVEVH